MAHIYWDAMLIKRSTIIVILSSYRGFDPILFRRLKVSLRREAILADSTAPTDLLVTTETNPYQLDYLCVLDFEATCEEPNPPDYVHEIIEFPVILLNLKTLKVVSRPRDTAVLPRPSPSSLVDVACSSSSNTEWGCWVAAG